MAEVSSQFPVVDASPLILLARTGSVDLLSLLGDRIVVPRPVAVEIWEKGTEDPAAQALKTSPLLEVHEPPRIPSLSAAWDLGAGETSVLTWALEHVGAIALLDDGQARRIARSLGISVIGTLGLVLRARREGVLARARPLVEELVAQGMYLSPGVMEDALRLVGE